MFRRPPRSTPLYSSAASDVYKRQPEGATQTVALVGKGITFDTGGISLKPPKGMETMKSDMSGSAAVLHTVLAAARANLPIAVAGWLCLAENMPSATCLLYTSDAA